MRTFSRTAGSLGIMLSVFIADESIKKAVNLRADKGHDKKILREKLIITRSINKGFSMNRFDDRPDVVAAVSAGLTTFFLLRLMDLAFDKNDKGYLKLFSLALMTGGALSNTYDRVFKGGVTDYISLNVKDKRIRGKVFNLSDIAIVTGSLMNIAGA